MGNAGFSAYHENTDGHSAPLCHVSLPFAPAGAAVQRRDRTVRSFRAMVADGSH